VYWLNFEVWTSSIVPSLIYIEIQNILLLEMEQEKQPDDIF
jgi:hypothetical protein